MNMELLGVDCDCLIIFSHHVVVQLTKNIYGAMLYLYVGIIYVYYHYICNCFLVYECLLRIIK